MGKKTLSLERLATVAQEFESLGDAPEKFAAVISAELEGRLSADPFLSMYPVRGRGKTFASFMAKARLGEIELRHAIDMCDIVGVRVIVQFSNQVAKIIELIKGIDKDCRVKESRSEPEYFDYRCTHVIIRPSEEWCGSHGLRYVKGLLAEIQIRTAAQHLWAEASHRLQYKHKDDVPPPLRRSFARLSAVLELVDLELERLMKEREDYKAEAQNADNAQLNAETLLCFLSKINLRTERQIDFHLADALRSARSHGVTHVSQLSEIWEQWKMLALQSSGEDYQHKSETILPSHVVFSLLEHVKRRKK